MARLMNEAYLLRIGKDIFHLPLLDALPALPPVIGGQQIRMMFHEDLAHSGITQQEGAELLGKDIVFCDRIPGLAGHFIFFIAWCGYIAKIAVSNIFDLIIVIKHHATLSRNAEILVQHIARENICGNQILDRIAVFANTMLKLGRIPGGLGLGQPDIQRGHAALNVHMADDDLILLFLHERGCKRLQLGEQLFREARAREGNIRILERVSHAAHTVVIFDQQIFFFTSSRVVSLGAGKLSLIALNT